MKEGTSKNMTHARFHSVASLRARALGVACVLAALSRATTASAERVTAESLYQEGRRAAQDKNWELACKLFRESQEREPAPGTLLNLADCEENVGALLAARAHFEAAAKAFRPGDERIAYALSRAKVLDDRIPKLTVRLSPRAPEGTVIERDGLALGPSILGTPAALDPGPHTLVVRAPGQPEERVDIHLAERDTKEIELPESIGAASGVLALQPTPDRSSSSGAGLRVAGWSLLGVGAAGVIAGSVGGVLAIVAKNEVDANCPPAKEECNSTGLGAKDRGRTWSTVSNVGFIAGGIGVAAGVTLLLMSSSHGEVSAQPVAGGGALRWTGNF